MRINFDVFKAIYDSAGIKELEIEPYHNDFMLRFDYWKSIDISKVQCVLPDYISITEEVIYDDDCGNLFYYVIKHKGYNG